MVGGKIRSADYAVDRGYPLLIGHVQRVVLSPASGTGDLLYGFLSIFLAPACDYGHSTLSGSSLSISM